MYQLRDYQRDASNAAVNALMGKGERNGLLILPTGCHEKGTDILMADGSLKKVECVEVGDLLMGTDGYRRVLGLHRGEDTMYRIVPIKGEPFIVNGGHVLSLYRTSDGKGHPSSLSGFDEISVSDYLGKSKTYKHRHKLHRVGCVDFQNDVDLQIDPYFIGLLLGDGSTINQVNITSAEPEVESYLNDFARENGFQIRQTNDKGKASCYNLKVMTNRSVKFGTKSEFRLKLERMGLYGKVCGDKFIPESYKTSSVCNRKKLLAGLLDTDAYYDSRKNCYEYVSKSKRLILDIQFLCRSLGFMCSLNSIKEVNGVKYYRCHISGDIDSVPVRVERRKGKPREQKKSCLVTGFKVEEVGRGEYFGFTLDGNHLYCDGNFVVHHNSGKSLVVADIASKIDEPLLVLQPSKEILEQNFAKMMSYGVADCGIYSASAGRKDIARITFGMIGSVMNHMEEFSHFHKVLVDEAHLCNPKGGMYKKFFESTNRQIIGLTATPYRLSTSSFGNQLKFLTRTRPRIFSNVLYYCQISDLLARGYLAKLNYYDITSLDMTKVAMNTKGTEFSDESIVREYERSGFYGNLLSTIGRLLKPKSGIPRKGILVFTRFVKESYMIAERFPNSAVVSADTPKKERERILADFKSGRIEIVANAQTLTTGFDYPELDTIVLARPTNSLSLYYQMCLDMETEILTQRGFVCYHQIRKDDIVAAYSCGEIVWTEIEDIVFRKTFEGEQWVSFRNQMLDFKVTGNHDLLVRRRWQSSYSKKQAIDVSEMNNMIYVPVSGVENVKDCELMDCEISLLGLFLSDGCLNKSTKQIHIVQSYRYPHIIDFIRSTIEECGMKYGEYIQVRKGEESKYHNIVHFCISRGKPRLVDKDKTGYEHIERYVDKNLGEVYESLSERQFDILLYAINLGDGKKSYVGYERRSYTIALGNNKIYADRLQSLALRRGWKCNIYTQEQNGRKQYVGHFRKVSSVTISGQNVKPNFVKGKENERFKIKVEPCSGEDVWCIKNRIGTIITRRKGKVIIMGNCGRAIRPSAGKNGWIVDMCGNIQRFGKVDDLRIEEERKNMWVIKSNGKQLTNTAF